MSKRARFRPAGLAALAAWLLAGSLCGAATLRLNCGGGKAEGGWLSDTAYVIKGGRAILVRKAVEGCGRTPAGVYQTGRAGRRLAWSIPDLPDGVYRVRLYFAELEGYRPGERQFRLRFEGAVGVPVMDVADKASGPGRALRLAFLVTVADGNGLQLAATGLDGDEAIVNGVEVIPLSPRGMALVPAGVFAMGDPLDDGNADETPVHPVRTGSFYMDQTEISQETWDAVYGWALAHGYLFDSAYAKGPDHPVQAIAWNDCVKWCNARSEREGRTPAYYTSAGRTNVYRTGALDLRAEWVRWDAGYRLPTEAEWEKAARGGVQGGRFPWGDAETIQHARANYYSGYYDYDTSPTRQYHPLYDDGSPPLTAPCGSFAPNDYGLYDMAGNVWEWCWDWYGDAYYASSPFGNPKGPATGAHRVFRGGCWNSESGFCRAAFRNGAWPEGRDYGVGFRTVLPAPL